jgi:hypothetical protein
MNEASGLFAESEIPLFDVFIKQPPHASLADCERMLCTVSSLTPKQIDALMNALRNGPEAKIGSGVSQDRADRARAKFGKTGLVVTVVPHLTLQAKVKGSFDGLVACPACLARVILTADRQCPRCEVFVDKVTEEFLLRRKIRAEELGRLTQMADKDTSDSLKRSRQAMEAEIRQEIRKELEAKMGVGASRGLFSGRLGLLRAVELMALVGLAFAGGNALQPLSLSFGKSQAQPGASVTAVDRMLDEIGPTGSPPALDTEGQDIDALMTPSGGQRSGKGISLEQALAAANTLAKSVGNTTAERAWSGGATTPVANPVTTPVAESAAAPLRGPLALDFARHLAQTGQWQRAQGVLQALQTRPQGLESAAFGLAELEVQAWALGSLRDTPARNRVDLLRADAGAITDAMQRAQALGRVGVVLGQHPALPASTSQVFLGLSADAAKQISDPIARGLALGDWLVACAEVLLAELLQHASAGRWSKAKDTSARLDLLMRQGAGDETLARLHALNYQAKQQLGLVKQAAASLDQSLAIVANTSDVLARATLLRAVVQLSQTAALAPVQSTSQALAAQLLNQPGPNKALALAQLALMYAEQDQAERANEYSRQAQATNGLTPAQAAVLASEFQLRSQLAAAARLHRQGRFAECEALQQKLAALLG